MFVTWTRRQWFLFVLGLILIVMSVLAWANVTALMQTGDRSWWPTIGLFVGVSVFSFIAVLVWPKQWDVIPGILVCAALAVWIRDWQEIIFVFIGFLLFWRGVRRAKSDMASRLTLAPYRSLMIGASSIVTSLVFLLSVHYYFQMYRLPWQEILPKFSLGQESSGIMLRLVGSFNPNVYQVTSDQMTVDLFLGSLIQGQRREVGMEPTDPSVIEGEQLSVVEGRKRFESLAGESLAGDEPVVNVFSRIINNQTRRWLDPVTRGYSPGVLPFILSFLLFLTLMPLAYLVKILSLWLADGSFWLCVKMGFVGVKKVMVEKEIIEE